MTNEALSGTINCLQGNMLDALMTLGYEDKRTDASCEWMVRTTKGEGVAPMKDKKAEV